MPGRAALYKFHIVSHCGPKRSSSTFAVPASKAGGAEVWVAKVNAPRECPRRAATTLMCTPRSNSSVAYAYFCIGIFDGPGTGSTTYKEDLYGGARPL